MVRIAILGTLAVLAVAQVQELTPVADYHQHLFSPEAAVLVAGNPAPGSAGTFKRISAADLITLLDSAGIKRALVLSVAYTWGSANRTVENEYQHVKAENDWTSAQVALYPDRLRAFCSFNPLKSYAMTELERCAKDPQLQRGLKLHFGNSDVDLDNPEHVAVVRRVFRAANEHHMAIVVHLHASISNHRKYGADEARVFLNELLAAAPDIPVQIAHLAGAGGYDVATDSALNVFADAVARHDSRLRNVWFDVTTVAQADTPPDVAELIARRIRRIGPGRVLYGSDAATGGNLPPREGWQTFRKLPLSGAEFRTIAENIPSYMRW